MTIMGLLEYIFIQYRVCNVPFILFLSCKKYLSLSFAINIMCINLNAYISDGIEEHEKLFAMASEQKKKFVREINISERIFFCLNIQRRLNSEYSKQIIIFGRII